jgi:ribonuclease-3
MPLLKFHNVEKKLGITFKRRELLRRALTHSSYVPREQGAPQQKSNEILEFLGDAVLELITREYLCKKFPNAHEGELSQFKKTYTSTDALYRIGRTLGLGKFLIMDKGEASTGGRDVLNH